MRNNKGFTLIELMIVVAIIAIISAIAIPSLMKTRLQSNETAAMGNLKTLTAAQTAYRRDFPVFADDMRDLFYPDVTKTADINDGALYNAVITNAIPDDATNNGRPTIIGIQLQGDLKTTPKAGYFYFSNFNYIGDEFMIVGTPATYGASGRYTYFVNAEATTYAIDYDGDPDDVSPSVDADAIQTSFFGVGAWDTTGGAADNTSAVDTKWEVAR